MVEKFEKEREAFEHWFLTIPDADETLIEGDGKGSYKDEYVSGLFVSFCAGWQSSILRNS